MPEVTVVAKRFTLVQAAQAAEFKQRSFILLEAFCLVLHPALVAAVLRFRVLERDTQEIKEGIYCRLLARGIDETNTPGTMVDVAIRGQFCRPNVQSFS